MMDSQDLRALIGAHELTSLEGPESVEQLHQSTLADPEFGRAILEDGLGNILANATISYREWSLIVLAKLIAAGAAEEAKSCIDMAKRHGATVDEILDVFRLTLLYSGAMPALAGMKRLTSELLPDQSASMTYATKRIVQLADHKTMVWDSHGTGAPGAGVPMLLIHALNMDHRFWREVFPSLAAHGRTIAYDLRGHGHARGVPVAVSLDQLAEDVRQLLDQLNVEKVDVYGASYGGSIAQHVALNLRDRVRSMGLLATWSEVPHEELVARATDAEQHGMEAQVSPTLIRWFLPKSIAENLWMVRYARNGIRRSRIEDWAAAWRSMSTLNVTERAHDLNIPVLVLSGKQDISATPDVMQKVAEAYPSSTFVSVDPGTHMMTMEQPASVATALVSFRNHVEQMFRLA